jgi:hypothetical protein
MRSRENLPPRTVYWTCPAHRTPLKFGATSNVPVVTHSSGLNERPRETRRRCLDLNGGPIGTTHARDGICTGQVSVRRRGPLAGRDLTPDARSTLLWRRAEDLRAGVVGTRRGDATTNPMNEDAYGEGDFADVQADKTSFE